MSSSSRIPLPLQPFVHLPPEQSLYLISEVLGASANWLILRYIYAALSKNASISKHLRSRHELSDALSGSDQAFEKPVAVVMISWMREYEFWKNEARRVAGLNLNELSQKGLFVFVDGLSDLSSPTVFTGHAASDRPATPPRQTHGATLAASTVGDGLSSRSSLSGSKVTSIYDAISQAITTVRTKEPEARVLLILDTPSILLATCPEIDCRALNQLLLRLRSDVYSTIIVNPADDPLMQPAAAAADAIYDNIPAGATPSPLETEHAAFVMGCVHQASTVLSCRRLGTGWAEDVSGVLRITRGGTAEANDDGTQSEGEWLYYVASDGSAKVWSRGERG